MFQAAAVDDLARDELARRPRRARARERMRERGRMQQLLCNAGELGRTLPDQSIRPRAGVVANLVAGNSAARCVALCLVTWWETTPCRQ